MFLEKSEDGGSTWSTLKKQTIADFDISLDFSGTVTDDNVKLRTRIVHTGAGTPEAGSVVVLTADDTIVAGIAKITGYTSTTVVSATVTAPFESTAASWKWQEGAWSDWQGWPKAVTTFQQRLFFGGTAGKPTGIWASETDGIDNFNFSVTDDTSPFFRVIDNSQNEIQWLSRKDRLFIGTAGEEFYISASENLEGLTPRNALIPRPPLWQGNPLPRSVT